MGQDINSSISRRLQRAREEAGLSLAQAARLLGLKQSYLGNVEEGTTEAEGDLMKHLADLYAVNLDWLLGGKHQCDEQKLLAAVGIVARDIDRWKQGDLKNAMELIRSISRQD